VLIFLLCQSAKFGLRIRHILQIRTHVDPVTQCVIPYTPHGRFVHVPPPYPSSDWANDFGLPWWKDDSYFIGNLSKKTRLIKVVNTLTSQEHVIEVCATTSIVTKIFHTSSFFNPFIGTCNYSAHRIIWNWYTGHWWVAVTYCTTRRGLSGDAAFPHRCTKCNSPPINDQCTNHRIGPLLFK